jgi:hypothetical protein
LALLSEESLVWRLFFGASFFHGAFRFWDELLLEADFFAVDFRAMQTHRIASVVWTPHGVIHRMTGDLHEAHIDFLDGVIALMLPDVYCS